MHSTSSQILWYAKPPLLYRLVWTYAIRNAGIVFKISPFSFPAPRLVTGESSWSQKLSRNTWNALAWPSRREECSFLTVACSVALQMGRWPMTKSLRWNVPIQPEPKPTCNQRRERTFFQNWMKLLAYWSSSKPTTTGIRFRAICTWQEPTVVILWCGLLL